MNKLFASVEKSKDADPGLDTTYALGEEGPYYASASIVSPFPFFSSRQARPVNSAMEPCQRPALRRVTCHHKG